MYVENRHTLSIILRFLKEKLSEKMTVRVKPTKIKDSTYLLVPKRIADMIELKANAKLSLRIKSRSEKPVLEYCIE